jgi:hypothetical protein
LSQIGQSDIRIHDGCPGRIQHESVDAAALRELTGRSVRKKKSSQQKPDRELKNAPAHTSSK